MDDSVARRLWQVLEPVHVVTYFSAECAAAMKAVGLRGYWMGYFGGRAAPLGPVSAGVVEAAFYGFHPKRVRRAVPDAWTFAAPDAIVRARSEAAATALRRISHEAESVAVAAVPSLERVVEAAEVGGRPLFGANRDVALPDDPVARLWQLASALREHRGDGHVALLAGEGLDGLESNVLAAAVNGAPLGNLEVTRGWSEAERAAAVEALVSRGLMDGAGVTGAGRELKARVEARTDALAAPAYRVLDDPEGLREVLLPLARAVQDSGDLPFPNPIGLPRL
ncbi:SCO6745 family protein [Spirillospora sp. CA-294931]|uniref:SCO6745 family protein n=1 Tax=Spirillospora sp. CA-294931 TaxID=3240042 RepID=UPI003D903140